VRYILGYGTGFFGIWDRQTPGGPILQFPRNDQGWAEAWNRFTAWEPRAVEVPQGTPAPDVRASFKGNYRSSHTLAMWVVALISLSMVIGLVGILLWAGHLADIRGFQEGTTPLRHVQDSENTALGMDGIIIWVILIAGVLWLIWQHRAHANLRALGVGELKYSPGWAVGWWFIPFANVVMPFLTMRELWKANDPEAGSIDWVARRATPILGLWWAGRLVTQILFQIGIAFDNNLRSIADLKAESWLFIAGNISLIVWGVLAILLVRSIDSRQEQKHKRMVAWTRSFSQPA
jgi:heme/copper-type cytochrome/quinol oxidase subunit 2